ncbi:MAG: hypothetical protein ABEK75_12410 [Salinibacter sp.]
MLVSRLRRIGLGVLFRTGLLLAAIGMGALLGPPRAPAQEKDYEEWLRQQRKEYKQYLSRQDKAFLKFLKKEWKNVRVDTTAVTPIDDKPRQIPRVENPQPDPSPEEPLPEEETDPAEPPPPNEPPAPSEDSAANPPPDPAPQQPSPEPDSLLEENEEQGAGNMEEAMNQLEKAQDEQKPASEKQPPEKQAPEKQPPEKQTPDKQTPEQQPPGNPAPENPTPENPTPAEEAETAALNREASLSFFGASTTVPYGSASTPRLEGAPGKSSIRDFWKTMAKGPYRPTLKVLQKQRKEIGLSDWGYYRYLRDLSAKLYGNNASNEQTLWTWFMMMKSGYAARVGYRQGKVLLMLPVADKIYGRPQMYIDGQRYYLMVEKMSGALRTYKGQHSTADQVLQLDEGSLPTLSTPPKRRTVAFTFQDKRHKLEIAYNPSTVDYLRNYPNVELSVLLGAGVSSEAQSAFKETLQPLVADRSPREALNLLLKFAQFATDYKRDQDHFGEERYLFPEESLATDYSDCEDRAILLAYLTRTLLDRDVVGLQWPNHVALAVRAGDGLTVTEDDHTVTVDGETYIYADPTYIGSDLGMKMPLVEGQAPEIITLGE